MAIIVVLLCVVYGVRATSDRVVQEKIQTNEVHFKKTHEHNPEFDHEAFLGKDNAKAFEHLTPQESKKRLGEIFHKIDRNKDGYVTPDEMKIWIEYAQNEFIWDSVEREFARGDDNKDGHLSWKEAVKAKYGVFDHIDDVTKDELRRDYIARDERRFKRADENKDGKLNPEEVALYIYPEHHDLMKDLYILENLEDLDADKNGYLSEDEYLSDVWPYEDRVDGVEPKFVKEERIKFRTVRDKNKDGKMDKAEIMAWILPLEQDEITPETSHLMEEADENEDGRLSKKEMLDSYELFVGSEATHSHIGRSIADRFAKHSEL